MFNYNASYFFFFVFLIDVDDEGIERDSDGAEDDKIEYTKDLDHILHVSIYKVNLYIPSVPM